MTESATRTEAPVVLIDEVRTRSGHRVGVATLNSEKTLNSLSLPMIEVLIPQLRAWRERRDIVMVLLRGAGDRAFCAGGDIQALYRSMRANHAAGRIVDGYADAFFEAEYRLDHALHVYPKPVLALGHGVVMGGGLGVFSASRYRLVTDRSRIAMPEVTIGLFPDAGASWILKRLPRAVALYLAATGSNLDAGDALAIGVATHAVRADAWQPLVGALADLDWRGDASDAAGIERCLERVRSTPAPGPLARNAKLIQACLSTWPESPAALASAIDGLASADPWLARGAQSLRRGCPTSVGIVLEQIRRVAALDLPHCFEMELVVATHCARNADFAEGVRALIVDKDNAPKFRFGSVEALDPAHVLAHFAPPWRENPLHDLEVS